MFENVQESSLDLRNDIGKEQKKKTLRVSPSTWPQEGAQVPRDSRMALAVSGNNGQEPGQISDIIIISFCHLWLHLRAFPLHLGIISHLLLLPVFPSDSMATGKMALREDAKMTYLV